MGNEWSVYYSIVKKYHIIKYLRSGNFKEGSSESWKRVLSCQENKHSNEKRKKKKKMVSKRLTPATTACYIIRKAWLARHLRP